MSTKQKKWFTSAFSQESISDEPSRKKSRSASVVDTDDSSLSLSMPESPLKFNAKKVAEFNSSNWLENFVPKCISDLAIHPKKIQEIQDWFKHCEVTRKKYPGQILLVTGPAGSGKTATIKTIAKEMKYDVVEWINPIDIDLASDRGDQDITFKESQVEVFKRFLFRSSRYKSIFVCNEKQVVFVEDFPNVFIRDSDGFNEILENYKHYGKSPLIFVVTDSKSKQLNIAYNLFPDNIRNQFNILQISFNPISTTLMKKALKNVSVAMNQESLRKYYRVPNQDVIDSINIASQGDIRNAIINLHFASLKGAPRLQTEPEKVQKSSSKSRGGGKGRKFSSIGRDESITMMHALGRVFNPKYTEEKNPYPNFLHPPEDIVDVFSSEPKHFTDFIHANYLHHFGTIEEVLGAIDSISQSDVLMSEYRADQMNYLGLNIAVRGVMVSNEKPVTGWMPVRGPKRLKKEMNLDTELRSLGIRTDISSSVLASDYRTFARIIKSKMS